MVGRRQRRRPLCTAPEAPEFIVGGGDEGAFDFYRVQVDGLTIEQNGETVLSEDFGDGSASWSDGGEVSYDGSGAELDGKLVLDSDVGAFDLWNVIPMVDGSHSSSSLYSQYHRIDSNPANNNSYYGSGLGPDR